MKAIILTPGEINWLFDQMCGDHVMEVSIVESKFFLYLRKQGIHQHFFTNIKLTTFLPFCLKSIFFLPIQPLFFFLLHFFHLPFPPFQCLHLSNHFIYHTKFRTKTIPSLTLKYLIPKQTKTSTKDYIIIEYQKIYNPKIVKKKVIQSIYGFVLDLSRIIKIKQN